ncbi:ankyrin repeat domain-containing protein [Actinoplanes sp. NPDC024001]|uniref:ankyrin repeat domain-containing protein n=1 Tax=Actinoplanes sp. NPDC024001 TaxID=3154598 RepID=UPI00340F9CFB
MTDVRGWPRYGWNHWKDPEEVRARLAAGADPDAVLDGDLRVLHQAAEWGTAEAVAELAARAREVDALHDGRSALWIAVQSGNNEVARALAAAGADPWLPMMAGWSPGRLSLAGPAPDLFPVPPGLAGRPVAALSAAESEAVREAKRLIEAVDGDYDDGYSLCCVSGIDAAEAIRRLDGTVIDYEEPEDPDLDDDNLIVGVTDVPGGCVVIQRYGFIASTPDVSRRLSAGTVCYAMYANPKSGNQGSIMRDGAVGGWDLHPGGFWPDANASADEILRTFLFRGEAVAYCCSFVGLRPADARAFIGTPDVWLELSQRDWWSLT